MINKLKNKIPKYYLNEKDKEFAIENYNHAKPFANFFPAIAGKYGIPMWAFYVNRGQAIASFGTKDKDHAILEFLPANKSWQLTSLQGFRTFIKVYSGKDFIFYEPFHNGFTNLGFKLTNLMRITSYGLSIEETNLSLGIGVKIEYFTIPNDSYSALARIVTIKNLGTKPKKIQFIDGIPQIVPFGVNNLFLKKLSRTVEAWMRVENLQNNAPFYKLAVDPTDRPEVVHIEEGNFYLGFYHEKRETKLVKPIVDPESVFAQVSDFSCPIEFLSKNDFTPPVDKLTECKTPCAMSLLNFKLTKGSEQKFYSLTGYMRSLDLLNSSIDRITSPGYIDGKKEENKQVIEELQSDIATSSSSAEFNLYAEQTYLDNIMRGGYPLVFPSPAKEKTSTSGSVFYLYGRKHGDLERDYNKFHIQPTYFSQGNGNYRDINQNRRCDVWFNPQIQDDNLITFFNLIQTDGFNPLVIKGINFTLKNGSNFLDKLNGLVDEKNIESCLQFLTKPFSPGDLIMFVKDNKIKLKVSIDEFLDVILSNSPKNQEAEHGEGFWTDHWAYNLDLLDSYLGVYPEKLNEIVFEKRIFTYYDNTEFVKPRNEKYVLYNGKVRQLHSLITSNSKREMIKKRTSRPNTARTQYGKGDIYQTTLINKLLCLLVNKLASLDPFGCGIEMEADKPNWFDALNGLPGLLGSSLNETLELKRLVAIIKEAIEKCGIKNISVTEETHGFLMSLDPLIREYLNNHSDNKDYLYWDKSYRLKEDYRQKTKLGVSGKELDLEAKFLLDFLALALKKLNSGIEKSLDKTRKIYYAYFINEVIDYSSNGNSIKPLKFKQTKLPFFLEPQVHALKLTNGIDEARALYTATKKSTLFDKNLKMYKCTSSLKSMPEEIGRCRVFTPGWLENESIWLHMEYKYMLELLKSGLYEEFYADFKNVLIPFQSPQSYGRSILENSSFLVSSAFPDKSLHGNGFVARLSGSTAEFLGMWLVMNAGIKPFTLDNNGALRLEFRPILKSWLFRKDNTYSFNFLSKIKVVYHNPKKKDTFGKMAVKPVKITFKDKNDNPVELSSHIIPTPYAQQIRARQIKQIDIYLG